MTTYYLAYGSNLHPFRLQLRLSGCELLGCVTLPDCRLVYDKRGQDDSGKGNLRRNCQNEESYGALYRLQPGQLDELDRWEGGYDRHKLRLALDGEEITAVTYLAKAEKIDHSIAPFDWYRDLVRAGASYLGYPDHYLLAMDGVNTWQDNDAQRSTLHQRLLEQLLDYNRRHPYPLTAEIEFIRWLQEASSNS